MKKKGIIVTCDQCNKVIPVGVIFTRYRNGEYCSGNCLIKTVQDESEMHELCRNCKGETGNSCVLCSGKGFVRILDKPVTLVESQKDVEVKRTPYYSYPADFSDPDDII